MVSRTMVIKDGETQKEKSEIYQRCSEDGW